MVRRNCRAWFGFGGASVLLACREDPVSFNTIVGGGDGAFDVLHTNLTLMPSENFGHCACHKYLT